ncbi:hypothetical protein GcC1_207035 [Golovinomyces cichoracearum]|uniref:Uncharacterized protein n=1 Tax=Golovinomyces cichoracearum TaxID=62708 RepID=A0A420HC76_9PEZI|nr:hypothetical protein GcC1_207035 [Golovinomyces cichoracearum]
MSEVKLVAEKLEALAEYRSKGAAQIKTKLGPPKSGNALAMERSETVKDADGDTIMTDAAAILAALTNLLQNSQSENVASINMQRDKLKGIASRQSESVQNQQPPAPWRSKS